MPDAFAAGAALEGAEADAGPLGALEHFPAHSAEACARVCRQHEACGAWSYGAIAGNRTSAGIVVTG